MNPTQEMIEAACKATILGTVDDGVPYHLELEDARTALTAALALVPGEPVAWQPKFKQDVIDHHRAQNPDFWEWTMTVFQTKEQAEGYGHGGHEVRPLYTSPTPHLSALADAELQSTADSRIAELEQQIANIKASRDLQVTIAADEEERARKAEADLSEAVKVMWEYARFETEEGKARAFLSKLEASHAEA